MVFFFAIAATSVAENIRAVSITPAAQGALERKDQRIGSSLVNLANSFQFLKCHRIFDCRSDHLKTDEREGCQRIGIRYPIESKVISTYLHA